MIETEDERVYVRLEAMTESDFAWNVERLRSEAEAKLKHADALERYAADKFGRDRQDGEVKGNE